MAGSALQFRKFSKNGTAYLPSPTTRDRGRVECDALFLSERALWHIFFVAGDNLEELISPLDDSPANSVGVENEGICVADHSIKLGTNEPRERLITWAVAHAIFHSNKVHAEARDGWRDTLQPRVWVRIIRAAVGRQSLEGTEVVAERRSEAQTTAIEVSTSVVLPVFTSSEQVAVSFATSHCD